MKGNILPEWSSKLISHSNQTIFELCCPFGDLGEIHHLQQGQVSYKKALKKYVWKQKKLYTSAVAKPKILGLPQEAPFEGLNSC